MSNELIVRDNPAAIMPVMDMAQAVGRYGQFKEFVSRVLTEGVDFGAIPGTSQNTLLKPGAEKLSTFFGLSKRFEIIERTEDWTGDNHNGEPFFYYLYRCSLYRGELLVAESDGSCNSWEAKYRYRKQERTCPNCGAENIRKSKNDGGWYCWVKTGGCGATFKAGDESIESQEVGRKPNPDIADQVNTFQKMAQKRALVAAVLIAVNASDYFTQDMEDFTNVPLKDVVDGDFSEVPPEQKTKPAQKPAIAPKQKQAKVDGMTALKMLDIINSEVGNYYNDVNHLRNAIRQALGDEKWDWPAPSDNLTWTDAQAVAIDYANAPKQTEPSLDEIFEGN